MFVLLRLLLLRLVLALLQPDESTALAMTTDDNPKPFFAEPVCKCHEAGRPILTDFGVLHEAGCLWLIWWRENNTVEVTYGS